MRKKGKAYECWVCKQQFDRWVEFTHHIRTGHLGKPVSRMSYESEIKVNDNNKKPDK